MVDVKSDPDGDAFASLYDDLDAPPLTVPPTPDEVKPVLPPSPRGSARKASGSPSVSRKASTSKPATAPATPSGNGGGSPDEDEPKPLSIAHLPEATKEVRRDARRSGADGCAGAQDVHSARAEHLSEQVARPVQAAGGQHDLRLLLPTRCASSVWLSVELTRGQIAAMTPDAPVAQTRAASIASS